MKTAAINAQLRDAFSLPPKRTPRVLIWGLGVHGGGEGMIQFFHALGWSIVVHDPKPKDRFERTIARLSNVKSLVWKLGTPWNESMLTGIDIVIKNPGVPMTHTGLRAIKKKGIPVTNDADIFTRVIDPKRIIGVTGTKGKTTTTTLIAHLLGDQAIAVGTPQRPFLSALSSNAKYIVAEYSSFDCDLLTASPHISVCTSLFADHLNRYASFDAYALAKARLWSAQVPEDIIFYGDGVPTQYRKIVKGRKISITPISNTILNRLPYSVHPESAAIAISIARELGMSIKDITARITKYEGEEGRREHIPAALLTGYNDTTATNPIAASSSIESLRQRFPDQLIGVIVGGDDKSFPDTDLRALARTLKSVSVSYLLPGTMSDRLFTFLPARSGCVRVASIDEAVARAVTTIPGGSLLLSPGATSFHQYEHEFDRGRDFVRAVIHYAHGTIPRRGR